MEGYKCEFKEKILKANLLWALTITIATAVCVNVRNVLLSPSLRNAMGDWQFCFKVDQTREQKNYRFSKVAAIPFLLY